MLNVADLQMIEMLQIEMYGLVEDKLHEFIEEEKSPGRY